MLKMRLLIAMVCTLCVGAAQACGLAQLVWGSSVNDVMVRLGAHSQSQPSATERLPRFELTLRGNEVCPRSPALQGARVVLRFGLGRLEAVEVLTTSRGALLNWAKSQWGQPMASTQLSDVQGDLPLRWRTSLAYVTYRTRPSGLARQEVLQWTPRGADAMQRRAYEQLERIERPIQQGGRICAVGSRC